MIKIVLTNIVNSSECVTDSLYWDPDATDSYGNKGFWKRGGDIVRIGCFAGQTGQNQYAVAIGSRTGSSSMSVEIKSMQIITLD